VKIRECKDKQEWLRVDFWIELGNHKEQEDVKAKSKFMSDIAGGSPTTNGPASVTTVHVGAKLKSVLVHIL
jgi:hypothetical protein